MSSHTSSMRDMLYEVPGPRARRRIRIWTIVGSVLLVALLVVVVRQFALKGQFAPRYWAFFLQPTTWAFLGTGFLGTLWASVVAGVLALVLGLVLMLGRTNGPAAIRGACRVIIDFFRGVPSLLLIYFFFLVVPQYGIKMPSFWMIVLPVGLAASGVLAEVFRAGVNAVPTGQVEAALSLGMSRHAVTFKIVLPQAVRFVIPTLISQLVVVVKDTTLAYVVSYPDMMQNARVLVNNYNALVSTYLVVAILYILLNYLINKAAALVASHTGVTILTRSSAGPL